MKRRFFLKNLFITSGIFGLHNLSAQSAPITPNSAEKILEPLVAAGLKIKQANFWKALQGTLIKCQLCPNGCIIKNGMRGRCRSRINVEGQLFTLGYGNLSSISIDPIEKKPVFHMLPGSHALSISTAGCVLSCKFCQNWQISQSTPEAVCNVHISPEELVEKAIKMGCESIAYTYNEPTVFFEYMLDTALLAKKKGVRNVMVSCGYINEEPLKELLPVMDVIKVDLKGFTEDFYGKITGGKLQPVMNTISTLASAGKLMDIVCLIIPGLNDDEALCRKMFTWLRKTAGANTSLFLSRFFPTFRLRNLTPTPISKLERLRKIAFEEGLRYVYIGNTPGNEAENTNCHNCNKLLIERLGYQIISNHVKAGKCPYCGVKIPGIWL